MIVNVRFPDHLLLHYILKYLILGWYINGGWSEKCSEGVKQEVQVGS